jgi:putative BNR repeat neuraminidase
MKPLGKIILIIIVSFLASTCQNKDKEVITFKENGSWCWFQDERTIIHNNQLIFGSVADRYGKNGEAVDGNIEVTMYDLETNTHLGTYILHERSVADDHNAPAFLPLPDGRLLSVYTQHNEDSLIRYRLSENNSTMEWGPERTVTGSDRVSYSNLHFIQSDNNGKGRIYDFYRGKDRSPYYVFSDDFGNNWQAGQRMITFEKQWPYVKYASDGENKIHFVTTESHPRFWDCSIYHAYFENGKVYRSDGKLIRDLDDGPIHPTEASKIFQGDSLNAAWTVDLQLDKDNFPYTVYSVRNNIDHFQYRYARWDGNTWNDHFLAFAGRALYENEFDYSGLAALDPDNPDVVYISTDADPVTEIPLISNTDNVRHYEIFKGLTADKGNTWSWKALTQNSMQDNIRPIMPKGDNKYNVLLWLKGSMKSYSDYDFDVVGLINP